MSPRIDPDNPPYIDLRKLLGDAFTSKDLRLFCQDRPWLRDVINRFGVNAGLNDMIYELFEFVRTQLLWEQLLDAVAEHSPAVYNRTAVKLGWPEVAVPAPGTKSTETQTQKPIEQPISLLPAPAYDDVEIRAGNPHNAQYPVHLQTNVLVGDATGNLQIPWPEEELHQLLALLEDGATDRATLAEIGGQLFQTLFSGSIGNRYMGAVDRSQTGLRLRLWLESPELQALPWELLYDTEQDEFLALSGRVLITRYLTVPRGTPPLKVTAPLGVLIVTSAPVNAPQLDVDAEAAAIQEALAPLEAERRIRVHVLAHAERWTLREALRDHKPHVLHFVGHGDVGPDGGVLMLEDSRGRSDPLAGSTLATLLKRTDVRLAVLNACLSARGAPVEAEQFDGQRRAVLGVGPALVRAGLGAVVANQFSMTDQQARLFAEDFYSTLARFEPVDEAVSRTREALMLGSGVGSRNWATPILFFRARDGIIFERS